MSDPLDAVIQFESPFSLQGTTRILDSVRAALIENWEACADTASKQAPCLDQLDTATAAPRIIDEIGQSERQFADGIHTSEFREFRYSPVSVWSASMDIWKYTDETIGVLLIVSENITCEVKGDRERWRMQSEWEEEKKRRGEVLVPGSEGPEWGELDEEAYDAWWSKYNALAETPKVWPQNRRCLLNIVEHLKKALPVKEVRLDPRLLEEPSEP